MSDLIVIGYDGPQTARQAYEQVQRLQQDFVVQLRGLAVVDVDADGKTHVDTPQRIIGTSVATGALFGRVLGMLLFVPGMALLGGAIGALMGSLNKSGIGAGFRDRVERLIEPGHSAIVIMASKITEDKFANAMQPFGGTLLKTSLSDSDEVGARRGDLRAELRADTDPAPTAWRWGPDPCQETVKDLVAWIALLPAVSAGRIRSV
jgi:uncharacterized membrane protein